MADGLTKIPKYCRSLDCRGSTCPGPLLEVKRTIPSIALGDVLEVLSTDPYTKTDLPTWAGKAGHEYLGSFPGGGCDRLFVRRAK